MKNEFLPKSLNGIPGGRACLGVNLGCMSTETHYHDCVEMIYVRRGAVRAFFDNDWHELTAGSLLFVPPGCIHRCVCTDESTEQTVIGFTDDLICSPDVDKSFALRPYLSGAVSTGYVITESESEEIAQEMNRLADGYDFYNGSAVALCSRVLSVYAMIYAIWQSRGMIKPYSVRSRIGEEIKEYVSENFEKKISSKELLDRFNISYSYLSKIMIREFGMSLSDYILKHRVEEAKRLLLSTKESIAEIGYECGFASSSAFISCFKKNTGKTPFLFRRIALGDS